MLRITPVETGSQTRLRIEGRITRDTLAELARFSDTLLAGSVLDLHGVTFVDLSSAERLRALREQGAVVEGCSPFVTQLLDVVPAPRTEPTIVEDELLDGLRRGDDEAFAALVRREGPRLLATARRMLGTEQEAEDALQEAFLQAHRAIGRFAAESRLSTWLHRIVVNAALMRLRSRRRKPELAIDELLPRFDEAGAWEREVGGWEHASDELLESAQCRAAVRRAIDRLPSVYREVLMLRDIEGFDTEETAELLATTTNAVKVRLHRARQALRTLLEPELAGAERAGERTPRALRTGN